MAETHPRAALLRDSGLDFDDYDRLLELAYAGTQEAVPWTRLLHELRGHLQANYVSLVLHANSLADQPLQVVFAGQERPAIVQLYETRLQVMDPFVHLPRNRVVTLEQLVDESQWLHSDYYLAFHQPMDLRYHLGADLGDSREPSCRLRISRPHDAVRFGAPERALCELLLPHLQAAVQLRASLDIAEVERLSYAATLDRLCVGVVLLDRQGYVLRLNQAARCILEGGDGLKLLGGRMLASPSAQGRRLEQLISQAVEAANAQQPGLVQAMNLERPSGKGTLGLAVRAAAASEWSQPQDCPAATVIIRDPQTSALPSDAQLKRLYGLTQAEAALTLELLTGRTMEDAACRLGVSQNTARSQLRAIFAKTRVSRQADLLRILMGGVAPLG